MGKSRVTITHPDRVLFPNDGITKADLADYYARVADAMLPHLRGRPLNMQRFPRGIHAPGFIQQSAPPNLPAWVASLTVEKEGGETTHVLADNADALVWLANLSAITLHMWLSRAGDLQRPDRMIFDLDPDGDDFETARFAARKLKVLLERRGLTPFPMVTGSRGLHVTVPLKPSADHDAVRVYCQEVADELAQSAPDRLTTGIVKEERDGRLFVDTLRNAYGHTAVAPYSIRARDGAPAAAPISWEMLDDPALGARSFLLRVVTKWLPASTEAWRDFEAAARALQP